MLFEFAENTPDNYQTLFVELIIPLPVPKIYTYRVPNEWNDVIGIGTRVVVQFGAKKIYTALVVGVSENPPIGYQAKYILDVLDETALLNQKQVLIDPLHSGKVVFCFTSRNWNPHCFLRG